MTEHEFRKTLERIEQLFSSNSPPNNEKNYYFTDIFRQYISTVETIPFDLLNFFEETYCPISSCPYLIKATKTDLVTEYYTQEIKAAQKAIDACFPIYSTVFIASPCNADGYLVPLGKYEEPRNNTYFLKFITRKDELSDEEKYQLFKAYLYTYLVDSSSSIYTKYHVHKSYLDYIKASNPELMERFEAEQHDYFESLGLFDLQEKLNRLNAEFSTELSKISDEDLSRTLEIWIQYDKERSPIKRVEVLY